MNLNCDICVPCATANYPFSGSQIVGTLHFLRKGVPPPPQIFHSTLYFTGLLSWSLEQALYCQSTTWLPKEKSHDYAYSCEP